jgi:hypothetical protein
VCIAIGVMAETYKAVKVTTTMTVEPARSSSELRDLGTRVWRMTLRLIDEGKLKPPPVEIKDGFEGVLEGIQDLQTGNVSGKKIVSRLAK